MDKKLICPICGEPTNVYMGNARKDRLCKKHGKMANAGEIVLCDDCNTWHNTNEICACKDIKKIEQTETMQSSDDLTCIICGKPSYGQHFCMDCWKEIKVFYKDITHLNNIYQAKEYYYNLKNSIFWINKIEYAQEACKKLYAIAEIINEFKDIKQEKIAIKDITYLLAKKKDYLETKNKQEEKDKLIIENDDLQSVNEEIADYRRMYPATIRCKDGHYVRSNNEKTIDDRLYEKRVFHEYETRYKAIDGQAYYPDFYLPDADVFIEYFGVSENQEKNNKKRKLFMQDNKHSFEFIEHTKSGILDEVVYDIIDKYNLNK